MKFKFGHMLAIYFVVAFIIIMFVNNTVPDDKLQLGEITDISEGWQKSIDTKNGVVVMEREITDEIAGQTITFYSYEAFVDAYVDNVQIYHFGASYKLCKSPGSSYRFIKIADGFIGKKLTIKIRYAYTYILNSNIEILSGDSGNLALSLLKKDLVDIVLNVIILCLGLAVLLIVFISAYNKIFSLENLYFSLLSICLVIWTNDGLFINQLLIMNSVIRYFVHYAMMYVVAILFICYLNQVVEIRRFDLLCVLHCIAVGICVTGWLTGWAECAVTLDYFLAFCNLEVLYAAYSIIRGRVRANFNKLHKVVLLISLALIEFNAITWFLHQRGYEKTTFIKLGICLYLITSISTNISGILNNLLEIERSRDLKKIAFTDSLTGLQNRYAFDNAIKESNIESVCLFTLDINNLKYFNDSLGHAYGDRLICEAANILKNIFTHVYRTGGDEFIAIETNKTLVQLEELRSELLKETSSYNLRNSDDKIIIEIACGYAVYTSEDSSYETILRRSDSEMYKNKKELKKHSKVKYVRGDVQL